MYVLLIGLNHKTAPVEIREKFAFSGGQLEEAYQRLKLATPIEGAVILNTCNRTEIYATCKDIADGQEFMKSFFITHSGLSEEELAQYIYQPNCYEAIAHLFQVSAGLDSMVLGETQILGQVKDAYQKAQEYRASDGVLNPLFQKALYVGKKVRTETAIDQHPVSVSYAAVELARKILGNLDDKCVMVVGAGEIGELATGYLMANGVKSVIVSNRSYSRAVEMAQRFHGKAVRFDNISAELYNADIVISCTAANHYVLREENCREILEARKGRSMIMIDIAVPRDIEPSLAGINGIYLYDIDDLHGVVDNNNLERIKAARAARHTIEKELFEFNQWLASLYVVPVISSLRSYAESIKKNELQRAYNKLGPVSEREEAVINTLANSIVNQLLHFPMIKLKEAAATNQGHLYAEVVKKIFDLPGEKDDKLCEN